MVTGNTFQILIDLKKKLLAILFVRQKCFNREEPVERVEIEEDFRIVQQVRNVLARWSNERVKEERMDGMNIERTNNERM